MDELENYFTQKEKSLEALYYQSNLPAKPNISAIRELLMSCLEEHYGELGAASIPRESAALALHKIQEVLDEYRNY